MKLGTLAGYAAAVLGLLYMARRGGLAAIGLGLGATVAYRRRWSVVDS